MDAVKVIKKSGAPGAVPAVTAYVDEPLLPKVSEEDVGKVIGVDENGELEAVTISAPSIPTPAPSDSGKVLGVDSSGAYALQDSGGGGGDSWDLLVKCGKTSAAGKPSTTASDYSIVEGSSENVYTKLGQNKPAKVGLLVKYVDTAEYTTLAGVSDCWTFQGADQYSPMDADSFTFLYQTSSSAYKVSVNITNNNISSVTVS